MPALLTGRESDGDASVITAFVSAWPAHQQEERNDLAAVAAAFAGCIAL